MTDKREFLYARDIVLVLPQSCFGNYVETKYFYSLEDAHDFSFRFNEVPEQGVGTLILLNPYEIYS